MKTIIAWIIGIITLVLHRVFYLVFIPLLRLVYLLDQNVLDEISDSMNSFSANYSRFIFPDKEELND